MRTILMLMASFWVAGCAALSPALQKGADAYDEVRQGAEYTLCRVISVGAWVRAYGGNKEKADAWRAICHEPITELPAAR